MEADIDGVSAAGKSRGKNCIGVQALVLPLGVPNLVHLSRVRVLFMVKSDFTKS